MPWVQFNKNVGGQKRHPLRAWPGHDGFTLIELLIVIAIIGILVGLLLPALSLARRSAGTAKGLSNLKQIGSAVEVHLQDFKGFYPMGFYWEQGSTRNTDWGITLRSTLHGGGGTYEASNADQLDGDDIFTDPNAAISDGRLHYSAHPVIMPDLSPGSKLQLYERTRLHRHAEIVLVTDGTQDPSIEGNAHAVLWRLDDEQWKDANGNPRYFDGGDPRNGEPIAHGPNEDSVDGVGHIRFRQISNGGANLLFADNHAQTLQPEEILVKMIRPD